MKNYRYGKFRFSDYTISWLAIVAMLFFSIASAVLDSSILFVVFPLVYAVVLLWKILAPHREQFVICKDSITVFVGKRTKTIDIPLEVTLVVSYADICPPFAVRTAGRNQTHILKDKIAVSILQKIPVEVALEILHRNYMQKYTVSTIQTGFDEYCYIYSFVCNQTLFDALVAGRKCLVIVPESLSKVIACDPSIVNVYIDAGC